MSCRAGALPQLALLSGLLVQISMGCANDAQDSPHTAASNPQQTSLLVDVAAFSEAPSASDPFSDSSSPRLPCSSWGPEETYLEVSTGGCPYATLVAPLLATLTAGTTITATAWHTPLTAPDVGSRAHLEMRLGGVVLLNEEIPIPASDQAYTRQTTLAVDVPVDTPLFIHVHNHGANAYRFAPPTASW